MHKKEEKHTGIKGDKTILYSCMLVMVTLPQFRILKQASQSKNKGSK